MSTHGHRIKKIADFQDFFQKIGVPSGVFSLTTQTSFLSVLFEQGNHESSKKTEILWSVTNSDLASIFLERDIQCRLFSMLQCPREQSNGSNPILFGPSFAFIRLFSANSLDDTG